MVLTNSRDPKSSLQIIEKYKVASTVVAGTTMTKYINEPSIDQVDLSSVKQVTVGGDLLLPNVARKYKTKVLKSHARIDIVYGSTETGLIATLIGQDVCSLQLGAVGNALPGVEIKVLDHKGDVVQLGVLGKIWVKTLATKGYWRNDVLNLNFLDGEGFHDTGDAGFFDVWGNLYLRGRVSDLINFRKVQHSPAVLENLLMSHPAIQEVAVVGKPHPSDIQHPTAFVVLRPEFRGTVTDSDIVAFVGDRVEDGIKLRGGINFLDSLPRLATGKVSRKTLKTFKTT